MQPQVSCHLTHIYDTYDIDRERDSMRSITSIQVYIVMIVTLPFMWCSDSSDRSDITSSIVLVVLEVVVVIIVEVVVVGG